MTTPTSPWPPTDLHIGGTWVEAEDRGRLPVHDPATGDVIADVASATVEDARAAVTAAEAVAAAWASTPPRDRAEVLRACFEAMSSRASEFVELIVRESGKSWRDAEGELRYAAEFFRWYSEEAVRIEGHVMRAPGGDKRILSLLQPVGLSVLVTPWNFPAAMITRKVAPALAAGCTTVVKPASDTPLTALALAELMADCGVPAGVVNVVPSRHAGAVVGAMLADERVRKLSFTGSTEVGRRLLATAADRVVSCSMELGGNGPFVVFEDADLDAAVEGAMVAKMRNGGESCIAANRFHVHRSVAPAFADRLAKAMAGLRLGPGIDPDCDVGPMINAGAVADLDRLVASSVDSGARILTGGRPIEGPGCFFAPTVLADVPSDAEILHTEIFGPIAPIVVFDDEDEAVAQANATPYGLAGYVYTDDLRRGLRVSERLEVGMVGVNRGFISDPAAPFGGVKESGLGREGGREGILEYLEWKYVAVDW